MNNFEYLNLIQFKRVLFFILYLIFVNATHNKVQPVQVIIVDIIEGTVRKKLWLLICYFLFLRSREKTRPPTWLCHPCHHLFDIIIIRVIIIIITIISITIIITITIIIIIISAMASSSVQWHHHHCNGIIIIALTPSPLQ